MAISMLTLVFSLISAALFLFLYRLYNNRRWFKNLPGPPHSFLWGHLKIMGEISAQMPPNTHPQAYLTAIAQKYQLKGIFYLDLWPAAFSMAVLTDPELMNKVTITNSLPMHPAAEEFMEPIVGRNVIAVVNGAIWKNTHYAMAPAFSWSHIRNMASVTIDECMIFRKTLNDLENTGEIFSLEDVIGKLIFDTIARTVFNFSLHAQTKGSADLEDLRGMIKLAEAQLSWSPLVKIKAYFQQKTIFRRLQVSIGGKIRERLAILKRDGLVPSRREPSSILDLMLRETLAEEGTEKQGSGELTKQYEELLITNLKGLLVGGHGTTTDTLCYIYMLLSRSPSVVKRMQEEHSRVFHLDPEETTKLLRESPQKLDELEYTTAVIKETLRLFPVGFGVREGRPGQTITYNNTSYPIDNKLAIVPTSHTIHYDPTYFPSPSSFNPERFLGEGVKRGHFRTFGAGPRACLGQNLAMDEMRIILVETIREWDFSLVDEGNEKGRGLGWTDLDETFGDKVFQHLGLSAGVRGGMMMKVKRIGELRKDDS